MVLHIRNNKKWESAKHDAAKSVGRGHKAVEAAHAKYRGELELMKDEELEYFVQLAPCQLTIEHDKLAGSTACTQSGHKATL